jgi:hypothetical protein
MASSDGLMGNNTRKSYFCTAAGFLVNTVEKIIEETKQNVRRVKEHGPVPAPSDAP